MKNRTLRVIKILHNKDLIDDLPKTKKYFIQFFTLSRRKKIPNFKFYFLAFFSLVLYI